MRRRIHSRPSADLVKDRDAVLGGPRLSKPNSSAGGFLLVSVRTYRQVPQASGLEGAWRIDLEWLYLRTGPTASVRKEVIQPQVPLRLPCYDFAPVTGHTMGGCLPCGLARRLPVQQASMA